MEDWVRASPDLQLCSSVPSLQWSVSINGVKRWQAHRQPRLTDAGGDGRLALVLHTHEPAQIAKEKSPPSYASAPSRWSSVFYLDTFASDIQYLLYVAGLSVNHHENLSDSQNKRHVSRSVVLSRSVQAPDDRTAPRAAVVPKMWNLSWESPPLLPSAREAACPAALARRHLKQGWVCTLVCPENSNNSIFPTANSVLMDWVIAVLKVNGWWVIFFSARCR